MRGRLPKPTEQHIAEGTLKARHKQSPTLVGGRGCPVAPAYMRRVKGLLATWREVVDLLEPVLDRADATLVEALTVRLWEARQADQDLFKFGPTIVVSRVGRDGSSWDEPRENPAGAVSRKAWGEVRQLCDRLGIGPTARARLGNSGGDSRGLADDLDGLGDIVTLRAV